MLTRAIPDVEMLVFRALNRLNNLINNCLNARLIDAINQD